MGMREGGGHYYFASFLKSSGGDVEGEVEEAGEHYESKDSQSSDLLRALKKWDWSKSKNGMFKQQQQQQQQQRRRQQQEEEEGQGGERAEPSLSSPVHSASINVDELLYANNEEQKMGGEEGEGGGVREEAQKYENAAFDFGFDGAIQDGKFDINATTAAASPWNNFVGKLLDDGRGSSGETVTSWDAFVSKLTVPTKGTADDAEKILRELTKNLEGLLNEGSSMRILQGLLGQATRTLFSNKGGLKAASESIIASAERMALDQGLDVSDAAAKARATAEYTEKIVDLANNVLERGYFPRETHDPYSRLSDDAAASNATALFESFYCHPVPASSPVVGLGASLSSVAGSIYGSHEDIISQFHSEKHSIVATGTTRDVRWVVSDHVDSSTGEMQRVLTVKGFDATDDEVSRGRLLKTIVRARPTKLMSISVHSGFLTLARAILNDVKVHIDGASPHHKIVLNGHSIGGSICTLLLLLLSEERGGEWCKDRIKDCVVFGAPPMIETSSLDEIMPRTKTNLDRALLLFDLPQDIITSFVQPWDPVIRIFSQYDPCFPLVGDLGEDGVTLYASGPNRVLRPLVRSVLLIAPLWPDFRDEYLKEAKQGLQGVGRQFVLLPPVTQYLSDRFASVNVNVPSVFALMQISADSLLPCLSSSFPLDEFSISFVPAALRSFIHHFHPAYTNAIGGYRDEANKRMYAQGDGRDSSADLGEFAGPDNSSPKWI